MSSSLLLTLPVSHYQFFGVGKGKVSTPLGSDSSVAERTRAARKG